MPNKTMSRLKIITLNVNGMARTQKRQQIFSYLRTPQADIYCLQETHRCSKTETKKWTDEWGDIEITEKPVDDDGCKISLIMQYNEVEINMICIYAPTDDTPRKRFFETLGNITCTTQYFIIAGDFNFVYVHDINTFLRLLDDSARKL